MKACMGGWCAKREKCPHHMIAPDRRDAAQRLCITGRDGLRLVMASLGRTLAVDVFTGQRVREQKTEDAA